MTNLAELVEGCNVKQRRYKLKNDIRRAKKYREIIRYLEEIPIIKSYNNKIERLNYLNTHFNKKHEQEIIGLRKNIAALETVDPVSFYKSTLQELALLEEYIKKYYITINIILRKELLDHGIPNIYVFQGVLDKDNDLKLYRNIVSPNSVKTELDDEDIGLYPAHDIESQRDYRKFYNRLSFRYMEGLTRDYSFDLDSKNIKNAKVLKRKTQ